MPRRRAVLTIDAGLVFILAAMRSTSGFLLVSSPISLRSAFMDQPSFRMGAIEAQHAGSRKREAKAMGRLF
jgi:hypothetical protein